MDFSGLPQTAQQFILRFFPGTETAYSKWEKDDGRKEYEVLLPIGTELKFDSSGVWLMSIACSPRFRRHHTGGDSRRHGTQTS